MNYQVCSGYEWKPYLRIMLTNGSLKTNERLLGKTTKSVKSIVCSHMKSKMPLIVDGLEVAGTWLFKALKSVGAITDDCLAIEGNYEMDFDGVKIVVKISNERFNVYNSSWF